uniref:Uncharacterized protein n=1 Tax=Chromera velia CCMP2878 TaxID=1169474 RepID=A0A0G4GDU4_9ALVE|mmetsp:Transcript_35873/g.70615  ORF Transcript_35873/g.70615 Transcript_35873/m.70615 type:complete len:329 (+) Transcript_35873:275-1261(+)|eukprot:Cvel_21425.t1-p1 / transcript=Cvel_21425.t1 / gene=Cvel_21425 / organism=Chromera_velia_CCMP2878 / gene_product=Epidermal retinol dehydrogenase 2, putative / transcript_product=Epidermal retinol dehydrogenase 2, putative / location=Cvel_scaffold2008:12043-13026(-) / protein_length=328 / sequence_SO=supercontig / SO=protein_coding / is_pseudo=false
MISSLTTALLSKMQPVFGDTKVKIGVAGACCVAALYALHRHVYWRKRVKSFDNQVVVVTGAASGMGRALALRFAKWGSRLALLDVNKGGLEETKKMIEALTLPKGGAPKPCKTFVCDVSKSEKCVATLKDVRSQMGDEIDVLINNAGVIVGKEIVDLTDADIAFTFGVNTFGPMYMTRAVLPSMMKRKKGHIVFMASAAGFTGVAKMSDYSASKAACQKFAESVREEVRFHKMYDIHVTQINPYFVRTGMFVGVKDTFILPMLSTDFVVDQTLQGIIDRVPRVNTPFMVRLSIFLKSFMPMFFLDGLKWALRVDVTMEDFKPPSRPTK